MTPSRRPVLALDDPLATRTESVAEPPANPYEDAATRQVNTRVLIPLHDRYTRLVRQLADEGFDTTATEIFHALLHEGPSESSEARDLVRRWRVARNGAPS